MPIVTWTCTITKKIYLNYFMNVVKKYSKSTHYAYNDLFNNKNKKSKS